MDKRNKNDHKFDNMKSITNLYRPYMVIGIVACGVVILGILPNEFGFDFARSPNYGKILISLVFFIIGFFGIIAVRTKSIPFFLHFAITGIPAILLGILFTGLCWWFSINALISML